MKFNLLPVRFAMLDDYCVTMCINKHVDANVYTMHHLYKVSFMLINMDYLSFIIISYITGILNILHTLISSDF